MFYYLNLLRYSSGTRHLCRNLRPFSFTHPNSANVISKKNGTNLNFLNKRLKSSNSKGSEDVKAQRIKLRASDIKRLLSLAKQEKWKITGMLRNFIKSMETFINFLDPFRCHWLFNCVLLHHNGSSFWAGQNPRYNLRKWCNRRFWSGGERKIESVSGNFCDLSMKSLNLWFQVLSRACRNFHSWWFSKLWSSLFVQQCL
jgi:hypothetical protein